MTTPSSLARAGRWFLQSGIQKPSGGVARFYRSKLEKYQPVSTEITGYTASTLMYLFEVTGEEVYLDRARLTARFLVEQAWDPSLETFPFEHPSPSPESDHRAWFFDCGIIIRGLLAVWGETREDRLLEISRRASHRMTIDFHSSGGYNPVLSLPDREALPHTEHWSRSFGCYQLKSALAWLDVAEATGDESLRAAYDEMLTNALAGYRRYLAGSLSDHQVMDRLHPYSYFLEALTSVLDRSECVAAYAHGIAEISRNLRRIAPSFVRSDAYAQLLRARIYGAPVVPLVRKEADEEASALASFQATSEDPRIDGGFLFGRHDGLLSPHVNPVSTAFAVQALEMWSGYQGWAPSAVPPPSDLIKVAFASGPRHLNPSMIDLLASIEPDLPLYVVAEFEPHRGTWIPYHVLRSVGDNRAAIQAAIGNKRIRLAALVLTPEVPFQKLRAIASSLNPQTLILWDADLKPITRGAWLGRSLVQNVTSPRARQWLQRIAHPTQAEIPIRARLARIQVLGRRGVRRVSAITEQTPQLSKGTTVVIPSRDGRQLLETLLPNLIPQIKPGEIIISDNGSTDSTEKWLTSNYPTIQIIQTPASLSFAKAVNLGIHAAKFNRILLLNNDMVVEPGFIEAINKPFDQIPDLFCATAQIFFPPGIRREETGKAVWRKENALDFPVRCDEPIPGEDLTWVLYGSGGCSLFDTEKLRALGGVNELYDPAYVEDLDFGYRAWKQGWPSVFCANARVEHRHRATTTRFYTPAQLDAFVEINYLKFLAHTIGDQTLFRRLWREAIRRLQLMGALDALRNVPRLSPQPPPSRGPLSESEILALGNGDIAMFPGRKNSGRPLIVIASPYPPFPLSHGGAVRMYNLMKQAAQEWDLSLITFCSDLNTPPRELLEICRQVVLVRRHGTHYRHHTPRPDTVVEFDSESFRACLKQTIWQWKPTIVQLEFAQMAQYAAACAPAKTVLVEHDITFDLQEQLLAVNRDNWELQQQLAKWKIFEANAWREVDCVVTMSSKDEKAVTEAKRVVCLPNGVDTDHFQPSATDPEPRRLLFIGSFAHRPNVLAVEFFLRDVWPLLDSGYKLHVIAGAGPVHLQHPDLELEGFVADVRGAYTRAEIVIAPLTASAGTNIKVLEAMAMGRVVVSTPAGINGLDLTPGEDLIVATTPEEMAQRIGEFASNPEARRKIESTARQTALRYNWKEIARAQSALYCSLS